MRASSRLALLATVLLAWATPASAKLMTRGHRRHPFAGGGGASCTRIEYNQGPLIQDVKVAIVQWGAASSYASKLPAFYTAILQSPYMDWLREYDEPGYSIARGSFLGVFVDPSPPSKTTVDDIQDVQPELEKLVADGVVPPPDANTLYMIHFAPGILITQGGDPSCASSSNNAYCAYHGNVMANGAMLRYAVIPDMSATDCAQGCGIGSSTDPFLAATGSASHEMIEAVTDPDDFSGWYDNSCGEIADMCEDDSTPGSAAGYTVQLIWSQKQAACVDHDSSVTVADYALSVDSMVGAIPGGTAAATVTATPAPGASVASLALTVSGLPAGIAASLSPGSIMTSGSSMLTFTVGASVALGSYPFNVTGASTPDDVIHSASGTLTVGDQAPPDLASAGPGSDGGVAGDGGTGSGGPNGGPPMMQAGCGCSLGGAPAIGSGWMLLLGIGAALLLERRRRRAQSSPNLGSVP